MFACRFLMGAISLKPRKNKDLERTLTSSDDGQSSVNVRASNIDAFHERILQLISKEGTIASVARKSGISESTVKNWADGVSDASRGRCVALAEGTGVSLLWLVAGQGPMMASETAPQCGSQPARLDESKLAEALAIIDRALVLTRRKATPRNRARLVVMAYRVLVEEEQVSTALDRIMQGVDAEFAGEPHDAK